MSQGIAINYKLDLYFPKFNLATELNENNYKYWNNDKEKERPEKGEKVLKRPFIRFHSENMDFDIIEMIDKIKLFYWVSK